MPKLNLIKCYGGLSYHANWIIENFPKDYINYHYVEPYSGGYSVGLRKQPSVIESYNDLNFDLYNIFWQLRKNPEHFIKTLHNYNYSEETFQQAQESKLNKKVELKWSGTDIEYSNSPFYYAIYSLIINRMSRSGLGKNYASSNRIRHGKSNGDEGSYLWWLHNTLPLIADRIKNVRMYNKPALDLIEIFNENNQLILIDPPWVSTTRVTTNAYGNYEMSLKDHKDLIDEITPLHKAKIILVGRSNPLYDENLASWHKITRFATNNAAQNKVKSKKEISLWLNY